MNNNEVSQNSLKIVSVRILAQEYYDRLHNIGLYRQIHIKSIDKTLLLPQASFKDTLDNVYQTVSQNSLLFQIKISLQQTITDHDNLWWPIRLWRRFLTHRDIEDKRELFHYICAKEALDKFVKLDSQFTFKEVTVMPKNLIDEIVDFFNMGKGVKSIRQSLDSLIDQVEQSPFGTIKKLKKILSDNDTELELEIPQKSCLEKIYMETIRQLTGFKYENLSEMDFQKNIDKIKLEYERGYQNLTTTYMGFEKKFCELHSEYTNLISDKAFFVRKKYDEYAEEKWEKDKLSIKEESEKVIKEVNDMFIEGKIDSCQSLIDFYTNKKTNYLKKVIQPIQEFYKEGMNDLAVSAYCIRQEQYIENEINKLKNTFSSFSQHIETNIISNDNNNCSGQNLISENQADLNKKYSEQKQELEGLFNSIKKSLLHADSEENLEECKALAKNKIRKFYKDQMVLIFHPDKNPSLTQEAEEKFKFFNNKIEEVNNILNDITYANLKEFTSKIHNLHIDANDNDSIIESFSDLYSGMCGLSITLNDIQELRRDIQKLRDEWKEIGEILSRAEENIKKENEFWKLNKDKIKQQIIEELTDKVFEKVKEEMVTNGAKVTKRSVANIRVEFVKKQSDKNASKFYDELNMQNNNRSLRSFPSSQRSNSFPPTISAAGVAPNSILFKPTYPSDSEVIDSRIGDNFLKNNLVT